MELSSGKKIMRNTIFLYIRMIIIMIVSLYTVRIVLRLLGVEDYGLYNAVGGVVASMSFLTNVLSNASQRFFAVELSKGGDDEISKVFSSIFAVYIAISLLIILSIEVGGDWLITNKMTIPIERVSIIYSVFHISLATFIISVLTSPFRALIIAYEKMDIYAYISLFEAFGKLAIVFLLYHTDLDKLLAYSIYILLISILTGLSYVVCIYHKVRIRMKSLVDLKTVKEVMGYSSWTLFGTVAGVANIQGNSILLNIFIGPIANAAFAISNQVSSAVQQLSSNFYSAVSPPLIKSYSSGNIEYMNRLFWFSSKAVFVLSFVLLFPIYIQTEFVLTIWLGKVSPFMVSFVRIMLCYSLVIAIGNPITTIVQAAGNVKKYHTIVDGFGLLVLPLSYILLKMYNSPELTLACMVVIFVIAHILRLIILSKTIVFSIIKYFKVFIVPCVFVIFLCGVVTYLTGMNTYNGSNRMPLIYMFFLILLSGTFSYLLLFTKEERKRLLSILSIGR